MRALISVSDKSKVAWLAQNLALLDVTIISTGGTAKLIEEAGVPVREVADVTGFPEMLDGRVKTLHPAVHGGLLARRDLPEHMKQISDHGISQVDILVVNFYPFEQVVAKEGCTFYDAIENIDIGGPAMVRSGAKNWKDVAVLTSPSQYESVIEELNLNGKLLPQTKFLLAVTAFWRVRQYDAAIDDYLRGLTPEQVDAIVGA